MPPISHSVLGVNSNTILVTIDAARPTLQAIEITDKDAILEALLAGQDLDLHDFPVRLV